MLDFCYTGTYGTSSDWGNLFYHVKVYVIGEKYDITGLKELATDNIKDAPATNSALVSRRWTAGQATLEIIRYVFEHTSSRSDHLRYTLVTLLNDYGFRIKDKQVLSDLVCDVPDFAVIYMDLKMNGATSAVLTP